MNSEKLFLAPECLGTNIELVGVTPDYYSGGVRQQEPVGFKYEILLREHRADKLTVKIPGVKQMEEPLSGFGTAVTFEGLKVRPYVNRATGTMAFSATAEKIKPVKAEVQNPGTKN